MHDGTALLTGISGYLGGGLSRHLGARGWTVLGLARQPAGIAGARHFRLGDLVTPALLDGASCLVHCAYDFSPTRPSDVRRVNVTGSERLFAAAQQRGIQSIVYVSSISAFPGCRSVYGQVKLEIEALAHSVGAVVIRPGLIYSDPPGAMFGRLAAQVARRRVVPLLGDGSQVQYLVHLEDVCEAIRRFAAAELPVPTKAVTVAHERAWTLRDLLTTLARRQGRPTPRFVPVPSRLVWAALRACELMRLPLTFHSDSVVSLLHQNPTPDFTTRQRLGLPCRGF